MELTRRRRTRTVFPGRAGSPTSVETFLPSLGHHPPVQSMPSAYDEHLVAYLRHILGTSEFFELTSPNRRYSQSDGTGPQQGSHATSCVAHRWRLKRLLNVHRYVVILFDSFCVVDERPILHGLITVSKLISRKKKQRSGLVRQRGNRDLAISPGMANVSIHKSD